MGFDYFHLGGEENEIEYVEKFKELYSASIIIPEGMEVFFQLIPDTEITHVWRGGKQGPFNLARATRISWIKEVLTNKERRIVKYNSKKRCIDFVAKIGKTCYVVRCIHEKEKKRYRFLTSFVKGKGIRAYDGYQDFDFGNKKSC